MLKGSWDLKFQNIHIIINPASGNNEPILNRLNDVFKNSSLKWQVSITQKVGDGEKQAQEAIKNACDLVAVYGGDGTVLDVASGMINQDVPLAILPGGTANALAAELGVAANLETAAKLILSDNARIRKIDVGKVGERYFLLRIGMGMIAKFSEIVTRELKDQFGIAAYIIGGIEAMTEPQFVDYQLTIDGEYIETQGTACLITNATALGMMNMQLSKHVVIDDGLLDVFIINNDVKSILGIAGSIAQIEPLAVSLQHWQGSKIHIETKPSQGLYGDGENEPFAQTPSDVYLLSNALSLLVSEQLD